MSPSLSSFTPNPVHALPLRLLLGVFAGARRRRHGQGGLAVVGPAGARVGPGPDDDGGLVRVVGEELGLELAQVDVGAGAVGLGDPGLCTLARAAELAEGDRVAAGLGGEVPPEAEGVRPLAEQPVRRVPVLVDSGRAAGEVARGGLQPAQVTMPGISRTSRAISLFRLPSQRKPSSSPSTMASPAKCWMSTRSPPAGWAASPRLARAASTRRA